MLLAKFYLSLIPVLFIANQRLLLLGEDVLQLLNYVLHGVLVELCRHLDQHGERVLRSHLFGHLIDDFLLFQEARRQDCVRQLVDDRLQAVD